MLNVCSQSIHMVRLWYSRKDGTLTFETSYDDPIPVTPGDYAPALAKLEACMPPAEKVKLAAMHAVGTALTTMKGPWVVVVGGGRIENGAPGPAVVLVGDLASKGVKEHVTPAEHPNTGSNVDTKGLCTSLVRAALKPNAKTTEVVDELPN